MNTKPNGKAAVGSPRKDHREFLRKLCLTAVFGAVASVLMLLELSVPFMPSFIKLDLSELPALLVSFAAGPIWGVAVCFLKNLIHLPFSSTLYVGELCNFLLGVALVLPAGLIYRRFHTRRGAVLACLAGSFLSAAVSYPVNLWISYPIYATLFGGEENILAAYQALLPSMPSLAVCLAVFNVPFTLLKGLLVSLVDFFLYKPLSPVLKGKKKG